MYTINIATTPEKDVIIINILKDRELTGASIGKASNLSEAAKIITTTLEKMVEGK